MRLRDAQIRRVGEFAEIIGRRGAADRQHDAADRRGQRRDRRRRTAERTRRGEAVDRARRLRRFGHGVGTRTQVLEGVAAVGAARERHADRCAEIIGAGEHQRHAGQTDFGAVDHTVVVVVGVDATRDTRRRDLAEIIGGHHLTDAERDAADRRGQRCHRRRRTAAGAGDGAAVERARGLRRLGDRIAARCELLEEVVALGIGGERALDRTADRVGASERHGDARDAALAGVDHAVVVEIQPDAAADAAVVRDLGEVVAGRERARGEERDGADHRGQRRDRRRRAARRTRGGDAVDGAGGLRRFGHGIGARTQTAEGVGAVRRGGGGRADRSAEVVGAGEI